MEGEGEGEVYKYSAENAQPLQSHINTQHSRSVLSLHPP